MIGFTYLFNFQVVIFVRKIDKLSSPLGVSSQRIFGYWRVFCENFELGYGQGDHVLLSKLRSTEKPCEFFM